MTSYTCPKGHTSAEGDFCDTCGTRIDGTRIDGTRIDGAAPTEVVTPPAAGPATAGDCPNCGAPRVATVRFCEDCGFDHSTGRVPRIDPPAAAAPSGQWTATVVADRDYFALNDIEGVAFPPDAAPKTVVLVPPQVRLGRRSVSKGTAPELDLAAETGDPGVSHSHALLTLSIDGAWLVSDVGSSNGTWINDEEQPLGAGQSRTLKDGDQVHVGAWTTITLHAP